MEKGQENAWSVHELGQRYQGLLKNIVAFEAKITEVKLASKYGQKESSQNLTEIIAKLRSIGNHQLANSIVQANEQ